MNIDLALNILAFVAGILTGWSFTHWRRFKAAVNNKEVLVTTEQTPTGVPPRRVVTKRGPTPGALILIFLLAALMLIGFGIQQSIYQKRASERDACYQEWGVAVIDSLEARISATKRYELVTAKKDDALDAIILVVIAIRADPPKADERDFGKALTHFANVKARQLQVKEQLDKTRRQNPFPALDCRSPDDGGLGEE